MFAVWWVERCDVYKSSPLSTLPLVIPEYVWIIQCIRTYIHTLPDTYIPTYTHPHAITCISNTMYQRLFGFLVGRWFGFRFTTFLWFSWNIGQCSSFPALLPFHFRIISFLHLLVITRCVSKVDTFMCWWNCGRVLLFLALVVYWFVSLCWFFWHICRFGTGPDGWLVLLVGAIIMSVYFCGVQKLEIYFEYWKLWSVYPKEVI